MSVWRSPVFYFGLFLVAAVIAALMAPFVVNWNSYKPDLEAYGRKLTGREVTIAGPVAVRLFPWPRLEADDVRVESPYGFSSDALVEAKTVTVHLSLGGLFSGILDVQSIEVDEPLLKVIRLPDGMTNYRLTPDANLSQSGLLERVRLDQISITNGTVQLEDRGFNHALKVTGLDATLAATAIEGPWRLRGKGQIEDTPVALAISTGSYDANAPFHFGVSVTPDDAALPALVTEAAWGADALDGSLRLTPQEGDGQKGSAEGNFKPLQLEASFHATADGAKLDKIKIAPVSATEAGTLIEGQGEIGFGDVIEAEINLKAPRIDADALAGAGAMTRWRDGGFLSFAKGFIAALPEKLATQISFEALALKLGGETLSDVRVKAVAEPQAIRINEAVASLPGRGRARFDGVIFPAPEAAELGGTLAVESNDLRALAIWFWPEGKDAISRNWKGSRGRFKMQGGVSWSERMFGLEKADYELEGQPGKADLVIRQGDVAAMNLKVDAAALDLDAFMPAGASVANGSAFLSAAGYLPALMESGANGGKQLDISIHQLTLNRVTAQDVKLNFITSLSGFEVKAMEIGNVGGARISGSGLVLKGDNGQSGTLSVKLAAGDVTGLLQLAGIDVLGPDAAWRDVLGKTDATFAFDVLSQGKETQIGFSADGASGILAFTAKGKIDGLDDVEAARLEADGAVTSRDGAQLLRLAGFRPVQGDVAPGSLQLKLAGSRVAGFDTTLTGALLGATVQFDGRMQGSQAFGGLSGKVALDAADASAVTRALGLPPVTEGAGGFAVSAAIAPDADGGLAVSKIAGKLAGEDFSGAATIDKNARVSADLELGTFWLHHLMAFTFLPLDGKVPTPETPFVDPASAPFFGEIFIRPSKLRTIVALVSDEAVIGIALDKKSRSLTLKEPGVEGLNIDVTLERVGSTSRLAGHGRIATELSRILTQEDGTPAGKGGLVVQGDFKAEGYSPATALAALEGKGNYWLEDASVSRISLEGFDAKLQAVKTPDDLTQVLNALEQPPGTTIGTRTGDITIVNGEAKFSPFDVAVDGANARFETAFDMTTASFTGTATITLPRDSTLPPVTLTYAGSPGALKLRSGTAALAGKLGYAMLARDMENLEKLQQEQQQILAKEEAQRKADEERFAAYQEQRGEMRNKLRQIRIQVAERQRKAKFIDDFVARAIKAGNAVNKAELAKRQFEQRVRLKLIAPELLDLPALPENLQQAPAQP